jgi:DNA-binding MarR family transcriptional regulator
VSTNQVDEVIDLLRRSVRGLKQNMIQELKEYNITFPQALVLRILNLDGTHSLAQLASRLDMTTSSLSGIVERLVKLGFVNRIQDHEDRRAILISLSDEGKKLVAMVPALSNVYFRNVLHKMDSTDVTLLNEQLKKFVAVLEEQ